MKVFVTGGFSRSRPQDESSVRVLGQAIASAGHTILQGYSNNFDRIIAEAAYEIAKASGHFPDPRLAVQSFISKDEVPPDHAQWLVRKLSIRNWDPAEENWNVPEPIQSCDVAIVMGGGPKTLRAANLCRLAMKPLVPITGLRGAAIEVFETELRRFSEFYEGRVSRGQYCYLDRQNPGDFAEIVREAVLMKNHGLTAVVSVFHASHEPLRGSLLSSPPFQMRYSRWNSLTAGRWQFCIHCDGVPRGVRRYL